MKLSKFCLKILREILRLLHLPLSARYYILSFLEPSYKEAFEIETQKFTVEELDKLFEVQQAYPKNILNYEDTIDEIIKNKKSLSRLGDGEEFGANLLNDNPMYPLLKQRLIEILSNGSDEKYLVCLNNLNVFDKKVPTFFRKHFGRYWLLYDFKKLQEIIKFNTATNYGDAYAFLFYFNENDDESESKRKLDKIKSIWQDRKILFVLSENSNILKDEKYFANAAEKAYVYGPSSWAFREYDSILNKITQNYDKDWLVYLELGSCATVLSYDLSRLGYQALDMGGFYSRIITSKRYKNLV